MNLKKHILDITVFISGAVVMIFEIVGSRVLAPYLGTSIFVWTSIIGIILGSLSLGYYLGGKLADRKPDKKILSFILFSGSVGILFSIIISEPLLESLRTITLNLKLSSVIASLIIFTPASTFLGMVSPYAVKLKMENLDKSGSTIGNLYALSTIGSILGTFLAGFYLIPIFGTIKILIILAVILLTVSLFNYLYQLPKIKLLFLLIIILTWINADIKKIINLKNNIINVDTQYSRVKIFDDKKNNLRRMNLNNEHSSAMFLHQDGLVHQYTAFYHLVKHFNPDFKKTLMIGGAAYSYPKDYLQKYPEALMDVVEIDPKLTELAQKHFRLRENPNLRIFHEDGRTYLNRTKEKYDAILGDAFKSHYSIPHHLTTREAVQKKFNILNNDGIVILNIISSIEGPRGEFLRAEYATYESVFPQVYLLPVRDRDDPFEIQNIILVALKSEQKPSWENEDPMLNSFLKNVWTQPINTDKPILTDDFAPVDYYISKTI